LPCTSCCSPHQSRFFPHSCPKALFRSSSLPARNVTSRRRGTQTRSFTHGSRGEGTYPKAAIRQQAARTSRCVGSKHGQPEWRPARENILHGNGVPERIRTSDPRFRKPMLYPAELPGRGEPYSIRCRCRQHPQRFLKLRLRDTHTPKRRVRDSCQGLRSSSCLQLFAHAWNAPTVRVASWTPLGCHEPSDQVRLPRALVRICNRTRRDLVQVRFTPDSDHVADIPARPLRATSGHSITSSARASSERRIVRPRALAVLRFTTNSCFVGNCTGKSPTCSPYRIRSISVQPGGAPAPDRFRRTLGRPMPPSTRMDRLPGAEARSGQDALQELWGRR
jgi:hypothetical protein